MQVFGGPFLETLRNLDAGKVMINLLFKLLGAYALLCAGSILTFSAVVVGVMEEKRLCHLLDWRLAPWARIFATVGKLDTTVAADELVLLLGRYHAAASSTADESSERED